MKKFFFILVCSIFFIGINDQVVRADNNVTNEQGTVSTTESSAKTSEVNLADEHDQTNNSTSVIEKDEKVESLEKAIIFKQAHVQNIGWMNTVSDEQSFLGTTGRNLPLESFKLSIKSKYSGSIEYAAHVSNVGWQEYVKDNQLSGTVGKALPIEAVKIRLTGELANHFDIYYRVHAQNFGWLDWAKNDEEAGTQGYGYHAEAIEIKLIEKGQASPGVTTNPFKEHITLKYQGHVSNLGWLTSVSDGMMAGTTGKNLSLEALKLNLSSTYFGNIQTKAHVSNLGWQDWKQSNEQVGTVGQSLAIESLQIRLTGKLADKYDIFYRTHVQNIGWLGWAKNGETSGTTSLAFHIEAVEIKLVKKGNATPPLGQRTSVSASDINSEVFVEGLGNLGWIENNQIVGSVGQNRAILGIKIKLINDGLGGDIQYSVSEDGKNWLNTVADGQLSNNQAIQTIKINLSGEIANYYDVYYRVHVQNFGWLGWTKNGQPAGSVNYNYHIEAVQISLNRKNEQFLNYDGKLSLVDKNRRKLVFIDPGHGGFDTGAVSKTGLNEKDVALSISKMVREKLLNANDNYEVIMSRSNDKYVDFVTERSAMSNNANADIFVSIHLNSGGNGRAQGVETYWYQYNPDYQPVINQEYHNNPARLVNSNRLANDIENSIIRNTGAVNRGVKRATFAVIRETKAPAVLVETGFIDNSMEALKLGTQAYQERLAQGIAEGIIEYFK